jgi:hypothetical protein
VERRAEDGLEDEQLDQERRQRVGLLLPRRAVLVRADEDRRIVAGLGGPDAHALVLDVEDDLAVVLTLRADEAVLDADRVALERAVEIRERGGDAVAQDRGRGVDRTAPPP